MSDGNSTCPLDLMDKQNSNGHFRLAISMAQYLHEVHGLVITSFKFMVIDKLKKQMSDGNSTCPLDPMDKQNSNGHFQIQWTLSFGYLNGTVSTSFKYMAIDQLKKQMSDGNSTCPLDPMDTRKTNGHFQVHLTNGMSNGLLIFPSDILHGYWMAYFLRNKAT